MSIAVDLLASFHCEILNRKNLKKLCCKHWYTVRDRNRIFSRVITHRNPLYIFLLLPNYKFQKKETTKIETIFSSSRHHLAHLFSVLVPRLRSHNTSKSVPFSANDRKAIYVSRTRKKVKVFQLKELFVR